MRLQAVFFDMGGTIDCYRQTREYRIQQVYLIRDCLGRGGIVLPWNDEQLVDALGSGMIAYHDWNRESYIELGPAEIWSRFMLDGLNISAETLQPIGEELALIYETRLYIREMRPEIPQVLAEIKALGLKIGMISNTQGLYQVSTNLKEYGIFDYFDPIILSSEYGRRKPDPAIFYSAARRANVPTGACVFVGDAISKDILGANRAGFRLAVQIIHPYSCQEADQETTPDAVIQNMSELLPILKAELEEDCLPAGVQQNGHPIKAIFFDAGDILYFRPDKDKNLNLFLEGQKLDIHPDFLAERARLKDLAFSGQMGRHDFYGQVLRLYGLTDPQVIAAGVDAMKMDDYSVEILDGVPDTIIQLKRKGYILGIITDTAMPYSKKLNWFDQYGFGHVWDSVISSKELGVRKPSPLLYESAITQVGITPDEAVFVGHKTTELQGARAVGMKTIAFNYELDAVADIYLEKFSDLLTVPFIA
ncbi:MAG TPA: HAD family hydrolase, partial [Bellilinea sp.]|nr:HAD family hydrolase [Bellilinea sp.]